MEVNNYEDINSLFDSLEEWLNDENRIVRINFYLQYLASQSLRLKGPKFGAVWFFLAPYPPLGVLFTGV